MKQHHKHAAHRIYTTLGEAVEFLGFTTFELALGFVGFGGFMISSSGALGRTMWLIFGWGGVIAIRHIKKRKFGKELFKPILTYFGILPPPSPNWPPHDQVVYVA